MFFIKIEFKFFFTEFHNIYPNVQDATQILTQISKISLTQTCLSKVEAKISCPKTEALLYKKRSNGTTAIFLSIKLERYSYSVQWYMWLYCAGL